MNRAIHFVSLFGMLACRPGGYADMSTAGQTAVADTVTKLSEGVFAAARRVDPDATFGVFSNEPDAAHLNLGDRFTRDSLLATYRQVFGGLQGQEIQLSDPTVTVLSPDAAVFSAKGHFIATPKTGRRIESDAAWTLVWVRRAGEWTLLHSHQSMPRTPSQ